MNRNTNWPRTFKTNPGVDAGMRWVAVVLVVAFLAGCLGGSGNDKPVKPVGPVGPVSPVHEWEVPFPDLKPGYTWEWDMVTDGQSTSASGKREYSVVRLLRQAEVDGHTGWLADWHGSRLPPNAIMLRDDSLAEDHVGFGFINEHQCTVDYSQNGLDPAAKLLDFPLWPGKTWNDTERMSNQVDITSKKGIVEARGKVIGHEPISTPYGHIADAIRIEMTWAFFDTEGNPYFPEALMTTQPTIFHYSPELMTVVREERPYDRVPELPFTRPKYEWHDDEATATHPYITLAKADLTEQPPTTPGEGDFRYFFPDKTDYC